MERIRDSGKPGQGGRERRIVLVRAFVKMVKSSSDVKAVYKKKIRLRLSWMKR